MTSDVYAAWTALPDSDLTVEKIRSTLGTIHNDELWTAAACFDRLVDDKDVQHTLCDLALERTAHTVQRCKDAALSPALDDNLSTPAKYDEEILTAHLRAVPADAQLCFIRTVMLQRLQRLNTFLEVQREAAAALNSTSKEEGPDPWDDDDDPWADGGLPDSDADMVKEPVKNTWSLSNFLTLNLVDMACDMAVQQQFPELRILLARHPDILWPYRLDILDSIPCHTPPSDFRDLLPSFDIDQNAEPAAPVSVAGQEDWVLAPVVLSALKAVGYVLEEDVTHRNTAENEGALSRQLTAAELKDWYEKRVDHVFTSTGIVDLALATIQHGASQGIPGLDEIGEDLSLLSRLVYDATNAVYSEDDWTLSKWRSSEPSQIVSAYLKRSIPSSVARDIQKLVMPYLFVVESRAERSGNPDPSMSKRLLFEYILSAPLKTVEAIFEASKPTLPPGQRIIKNDENMVRVALACLYGSGSLSEWSSMSRIFECLPAWETERAGEAEDEADATIVSLGAFVTPSTDRPQCTPSDLLLFFNPLPINSLSRALDILDVHLESGEILARWNVPAPLCWFLQSSGDVNEQRAWATRMARRAGQGLEKQEEWHKLLHDMLKLGGSGENGLRGAFGLLGRIDILQIFFNGLLTAGKFKIAKGLLKTSKRLLALDPQTVEDICLASSRELYDNASSGNYKFGDMLLAYECLDVPAPTPRLIKEKEFIEATSRISSFNVTSRGGVPISPIEIRLTQDRLSLVSRVLSSNPDAYKHTEVILDLVYKLGYRDDIVAEVKTLAMIADTALQAEDFSRAYEICERMVNIVRDTTTMTPDSLDPNVQQIKEVCWVSCFQLGRQTEYADLDKKLLLLGHGLELCPPDRLHDALSAWRRLENDDIVQRRERITRGLETRTSQRPKGHPLSPSAVAANTASSIAARFQDLHIPSPQLLNTPDAAAIANKAFSRVAANFNFARGRTLVSEEEGERSRSGSRPRIDAHEVSTQANRVLQRGIGWLLGGDE